MEGLDENKLSQINERHTPEKSEKDTNDTKKYTKMNYVLKDLPLHTNKPLLKKTLARFLQLASMEIFMLLLFEWMNSTTGAI